MSTIAVLTLYYFILLKQMYMGQRVVSMPFKPSVGETTFIFCAAYFNCFLGNFFLV